MYRWNISHRVPHCERYHCKNCFRFFSWSSDTPSRSTSSSSTTVASDKGVVSVLSSIPPSDIDKPRLPSSGRRQRPARVFTSPRYRSSFIPSVPIFESQSLANPQQRLATIPPIARHSNVIIIIPIEVSSYVRLMTWHGHNSNGPIGTSTALVTTYRNVTPVSTSILISSTS